VAGADVVDAVGAGGVDVGVDVGVAAGAVGTGWMGVFVGATDAGGSLAAGVVTSNEADVAGAPSVAPDWEPHATASAPTHIATAARTSNRRLDVRPALEPVLVGVCVRTIVIDKCRQNVEPVIRPDVPDADQLIGT
jgi:hypothetical protein